MTVRATMVFLLLAMVVIGGVCDKAPMSGGTSPRELISVPAWMTTWSGDPCEAACPNIKAWISKLIKLVFAGTLKLDTSAPIAEALAGVAPLMKVSCDAPTTTAVGCAVMHPTCAAAGTALMGAVPCLCACPNALPGIQKLGNFTPGGITKALADRNTTALAIVMSTMAADLEGMITCFDAQPMCAGLKAMDAVAPSLRLWPAMKAGQVNGCTSKAMACDNAALLPCSNYLKGTATPDNAQVAMQCCDAMTKVSTCAGNGTNGKSCMGFLLSSYDLLSAKVDAIRTACPKVTLPSNADLKAYPGNINGVTTPIPKTTTTGKATTKAPTTAAPVAPIEIKGGITMNVPNAVAFMADTVAKDAVKTGVAVSHSVTGSTLTKADVTLTVTKSSRRMSEGRQLAAESVKVDFTIQVKTTSKALQDALTTKAQSVQPAQLQTDIVSAIAASPKGSTYTITVVSKKTPTTQAASGSGVNMETSGCSSTTIAATVLSTLAVAGLA